MRSIGYFVAHPRDLLIGLLRWAHPLFSDELYLRLLFRLKMGYRLHLKHPRTFNEKLQWLKLNDHNPAYVDMVDKVKVKDYVRGVLGEDVIIPTLGVWGSFDEIDFEGLPEQFVLKTNHSGGSTGVVICREKKRMDKDAARRQLEESLRRNTYAKTKEWPYKNVVPCIFAEAYIGDESSQMEEYKFWCFNGKVQVAFTCEGRFSSEGVRFNYYSREWQRLPFAGGGATSEHVCEMPPLYERMVEYAEKLAVDMAFVRVDLYNDGVRVYFGEITFYDSSGFGKFTPEVWDERLGALIDLSGVRVRKD